MPGDGARLASLLTRQVQVDSPAAFVTGGSSGAGFEYALRLASLGYRVVAVGRDEQRLANLACRAMSDHGSTVKIVVADVSTESGMSDMLNEFRQAQPRFVVDCAAAAHYKPFEQLDPLEIRELVMTNVLSPTRLLHEFISGHPPVPSIFVAFSSMFGFASAAGVGSLPGRALYAASKAFVREIMRNLIAEIQDENLALQVVCPGAIASRFHTRQGRTTPENALSCSDVVDSSLIGLSRGESVCIPQLRDDDMLRELEEIEMKIFSSSALPTIAPRYVPVGSDT